MKLKIISKTELERKQLSEGQKKQLYKQGYRMVGEHSAVKICEWTKNMIRGKGGCYKFIFYGIRSHQCMQMTTSMFCASRCKFCWRGQKAPVGKKWYGPIDSPEHIINHSIDEHLKLLKGFGGDTCCGPEIYKKQREEVRHVALSLTGEPITYPLIEKLLAEFHKRKISTFLVSNAQFPDAMKKIKNVTQLYLSIDAPNKEKLKEIDNPLFKDYWERMLECLDILSTRSYRTCIRLTLLRNVNMGDLNGYAELIRRGKPDFIELKSYVWVGESQRYYKVMNMPFIDEVRDFGEKLLGILDEYESVDEHKPSTVVLLMRKEMAGKRYIDFVRFFELIESGKEFGKMDYSSKIMKNNA